MTTTPTNATTAASTPKSAAPKASAKGATTAKTPAKGATTAKATKAADKPAPKTPRTLASTDGTQKCEGACGQVLPLTKFPTKHAGKGVIPERGKVCRADLLANRDAKKAAAKN